MIPKFINSKDKILVLFDMDGVVAEYVAGESGDIINEVPNVFFKKRPIKCVVSIAKQLADMKNITVGILSSCEYKSQAMEKTKWLKKYMPFIAEENMQFVIWAEENIAKDSRRYAKEQRIREIDRKNLYNKIYLIEDNHTIINATNSAFPNCAHHFSELLD